MSPFPVLFCPYLRVSLLFVLTVAWEWDSEGLEGTGGPDTCLREGSMVRSSLAVDVVGW